MSVSSFLDTFKAVCLCTLTVATTAVMFKFYNILKGVDSVVSEISTNVVPGVNNILSTSNNLLTAVSNNLNTSTATLNSNDVAMAISNATVTFVNNLDIKPGTYEQIKNMIDFIVGIKRRGPMLTNQKSDQQQLASTPNYSPPPKK